MKTRFILMGIVTSLLAACANITLTPAITYTPVAIVSTVSVPTVIPTPTLVRVTLTVKSTLVNCRFGPGITYELINELEQGKSTRVVGRNESSTWWYVHDPGNPNGYCWVSADVTETQGVVEELPVIEPPVVTVTDVSLRVEPSRIVVNCDQFPQTVFFEAEITSNGPTYVTWRWEASTGVSSNDEILVIEQAGTQLINGYYQIGTPNEYWINLHILTPNEWVEQVKFPVSCTP